MNKNKLFDLYLSGPLVEEINKIKPDEIGNVGYEDETGLIIFSIPGLFIFGHATPFHFGNDHLSIYCLDERMSEELGNALDFRMTMRVREDAEAWIAAVMKFIYVGV